MEAGKTPSSSSSDVSLIPPQHLSKKGAAEEKEEDDSPPSKEDVSLILPQHLLKKRALSSSSSEEDVSLPHQHLSKKWPPPMPMEPPPLRVCGSGGPMKEEDCFIVKLSQNGNLDGEQDESIHKQEAVCRLCFKLLGETDSVLKTKCKCQFTLLHKICGDQWSAPKCNSCQQIILTVPVTISSSAKKPREKKGGCISFFGKK